ncbi:MAG TPA: nicotinate phosphoribosyltransferase [Nitrospiraceae bacterium]|nr:nicotinate phosphoribosyltransferase [Nitrospiraceae bacterium]
MNPCSTVLLTDFYQLIMMEAYVEQGMTDIAVFEFFVRRVPAQRGFLMAAGLEQVLGFLEQLHVSQAELEWLKQTGRFSRSCLDYLETFRFSGDIHAMQEGTVFFPNEPILRVTAPLPQAQLVETRIMNLLNFQTLIASKAARSVLVAGGKPLIDFGLRRAHGAEAGLLAARASYLAGFAGTATVLAGMEYGIPIYGTMAHSFVQAHKDEATAFEHFALAQPENAILLIDTYDTEAAAHKVVALAPSLKQQGIMVKAVRLDSGDLADHARKVRRILDEGGLRQTQILASGNLDEYRLERLSAGGAPIDSFAIGTAMTTSADAPSLDCAYKLQEYAGRPCRKRSEGKATWPGRKQVYRQYTHDGRCDYDVVTTHNDHQAAEPLLQPVMTEGRRLVPVQKLTKLRERAATQLARLPDSLRSLECAHHYDVRISQSLQDLARVVDQCV